MKRIKKYQWDIIEKNARIWERFKYRRGKEKYEFTTDEHFLTMLQREKLLDEMFKLVVGRKDLRIIRKELKETDG